jgi:hypothetical protein
MCYAAPHQGESVLRCSQNAFMPAKPAGTWNGVHFCVPAPSRRGVYFLGFQRQQLPWALAWRAHASTVREQQWLLLVGCQRSNELRLPCCFCSCIRPVAILSVTFSYNRFQDLALAGEAANIGVLPSRAGRTWGYWRAGATMVATALCRNIHVHGVVSVRLLTLGVAGWVVVISGGCQMHRCQSQEYEHHCRHG